jgi:hypothetical protein
MTETVFRATYSDFVIRKTRSVAVIQLEIPIEQAPLFVERFGIPLPGQEKWVALALLGDAAFRQPEVTPTKTVEVAAPVTEPQPPAKLADKWSGADAERALRRAGILANDVAFRRWIMGDLSGEACDPEYAARFIREWIGVQSRNEILVNPDKLAAFMALEGAFLVASGRQSEAR